MAIEVAERLASYLRRRDPATREQLVAAGHVLGFVWPAEFVELMTITDGGEGWVGDFYLAVHRIDDTVRYNRELPMPGLVRFGSDGGDEAFAFRRSAPREVVIVDPISPDDSVIPQGDLGSFLDAMLHGTVFEPANPSLAHDTRER